MGTQLDVALLQLSPHGRDTIRNLEKGMAACRDAAVAGAQIALFPEMWSIGYDLRDGESAEALSREAIGREDRFVKAFADAAAELDLAVAVTYLERGTDRPRNTVALFDCHGELALEYAKVHTCDFDREAVIAPGEDFPVCDLDTAIGTVRVGAMICFDVLFPEAARVLMLNGAELILMPNACDFEPWRISVLQTRAVENKVAIAMANYPGRRMEGHSCAFDPMPFREGDEIETAHRDSTIVRAGRAEGIYLARFDLDELREFREREIPIGRRRPEAYRRIVEGEDRPRTIRSDAGEGTTKI